MGISIRKKGVLGVLLLQKCKTECYITPAEARLQKEDIYLVIYMISDESF